MSKIKLDIKFDQIGKGHALHELLVDDVRWDQIHALLLYSNASRQSGTHATKDVSEVSGTGKKPFRQKGTGRARMGTLRPPQARGGAVHGHGPVPRSHAIKLNKKVKLQALLSLLSVKQKHGKLLSADNFVMDKPSTAAVANLMEEKGMASILFVDGEHLKTEFLLSTRNLENVHCLSQKGLNVRDLMKFDCVCFSKDGMEQFSERVLNGR